MPSPYTQYGGASGARDALQQMIVDRLKAEAVKQQLAQQGIENAQRDRQLNIQEQTAQQASADRNAAAEERGAASRMTGALRLAPMLKPGQMVQPGDATNLREAGVGSLLQDQTAAPASTIYQGTADQGGKVGSIRTMSQPAQQAGTVFQGTQGQEDAATKAADLQRYRDTQNELSSVRNDIAQSRADAAANKPDHSGDTRMDRSYQFHRGALDKLASPLEQQAQRMGRLIETVNQHTPQADALVAPELLTVMAGGAGSGLRINEAEISRIVGGRSNLESLKAALNRWQLDPSKALSITEPQRQQIRDLITSVHDKSQSQLDIVNKAGDALIDAPDVVGHRRILGDVRRQLQASAEAGGGKAAPLTAKNPKTGEVIYSDDQGKTWHK